MKGTPYPPPPTHNQVVDRQRFDHGEFCTPRLEVNEMCVGSMVGGVGVRGGGVAVVGVSAQLCLINLFRTSTFVARGNICSYITLVISVLSA